MRPTTLACCLAFGLLVGLAGCGRSGQPANGSAAGAAPAKAPMIFRVGNGSEVQDLDPQTVTGVPEHKVIMALFEGLVTEDAHGNSPMPGLAESWTISADGLVYTFTLRPNLRWSNGDPITAPEIVESFRRILSPALASEYAYLVYNFVAGARDYYEGRLTDFAQVGFKAPDDRTFVVTLNHPTPYLLKIMASHYSWWPVPTHIIAQHGPLDRKRLPWTKPGNLVGSGPFVLESWEPNKLIAVGRNPHYWDAATVKLDGIHFYPTEDLATDERMFRTGQVDMTYELPNTKIDAYRRDHPESLQIDPYLGIYFYRCNTSRPPLNDKRVRRALALAIDRESIVKNVTRGDEQPAYAVSYPDNSGYTARARLTGTIAEAQRLLAEAGYPGGQGCPTIELVYNTSQNHRAIAEAIQQMWRKHLGVNVELRNEEWKVYIDMQHTGNFMLQRGGWIADYVDPQVFLEIWESNGGNNNTNWSSPEYDRLLHSALAAKTDAERYELYQQMDAILVDELPVIPIYYYTKVAARSPRIKGFYPTLLDNHPYKYIYLAD